VYGVFSVTSFFEDGLEAETAQGVALADAAYAAGVQHYVYSSVASADEDTGIPHFEIKWRVEQHLRYLGLRATVVRPVYFMENFWFPRMHDSIVGGTLPYPIAPDTHIQMIAVDDVGYSVAQVFERPEKYIGKTVDLAGDELTMPQAAKVLGDAMDCNVEFQQTPVEEIRQYDPDYAAMLDWFNEGGYHVDMEMMRVFNPHVHKFDDWVHETGWGNEECGTPTYIR
jgi:uncharacterized protein YbjT (DUF2867 family)